MDLTLRILNSAGVLVLDLNAGGYSGIVLPDQERVWRRVTTTSPWVDGDDVGHETLAAQTLSLKVRVRGATWAQVETRRRALVDALETPRFLLAIGADGVVETWRATRADTVSPRPPDAVVNRMRVVTASVPVQPTPTVTGL